MGKRSRRQQRLARPEREPDDRDALKAPWHPVPLVELCVLLGLILIVLGFLSLGDRRGAILILCGLTLGSLAGLDTTLREHFAGHRPHATLLASLPAVVLAGVLGLAGAPWLVVPAAAIAVFASAWTALRGAFARRSAAAGP